MSVKSINRDMLRDYFLYHLGKYDKGQMTDDYTFVYDINERSVIVFDDKCVYYSNGLPSFLQDSLIETLDKIDTWVSDHKDYVRFLGYNPDSEIGYFHDSFTIGDKSINKHIVYNKKFDLLHQVHISHKDCLDNRIDYYDDIVESYRVDLDVVSKLKSGEIIIENNLFGLISSGLAIDRNEDIVHEFPEYFVSETNVKIDKLVHLRVINKLSPMWSKVREEQYDPSRFSRELSYLGNNHYGPYVRPKNSNITFDKDGNRV